MQYLYYRPCNHIIKWLFDRYSLDLSKDISRCVVMNENNRADILAIHT